MLHAFLLGAIAQLSLVLSALLAFRRKFPPDVIGALAAFGAGALLAPVGVNLLPEAKALSLTQVALWMLVGASLFMAGEHLVEKKFGTEGPNAALGIVVGAIVDGIPESVIFGIQIERGQTVSFAFVAAVFVSNLPQAIAPSAELGGAGWTRHRVAWLWMKVVLACGLAAALGYGVASLLDGADGARMAALAAGGILTMLSDSLVPFAHERSKRAGMWTVLGVCAALAMN